MKYTFIDTFDCLFIGVNILRLILNNIIYNIINNESHILFFMFSFSESEIDCGLTCLFTPFWFFKNYEINVKILMTISNISSILILFLIAGHVLS